MNGSNSERGSPFFADYELNVKVKTDLGPSYPGRQVQLNVLTSSTQVALLKQGFVGLQSSTKSTSQFVPEYRSGHEQL